MLTKIKEQIATLPNVSFITFYQQFIMSVQDSNIDTEFRFMVNRNRIDVNTMQLLIQNTYERMKSIYDYG